jgi:hypothetical protein
VRCVLRLFAGDPVQSGSCGFNPFRQLLQSVLDLDEFGDSVLALLFVVALVVKLWPVIVGIVGLAAPGYWGRRVAAVSGATGMPEWAVPRRSRPVQKTEGARGPAQLCRLEPIFKELWRNERSYE